MTAMVQWNKYILEESHGIFDKLKKGLTKTKESLIKNIESVVIGYAQIDEEFLEDLEWYSFPAIWA